jgi:hypothetical protein
MSFFAPFMGSHMPDSAVNVLLPLSLPTQKSLRGAVANIVRDVQREYGETDQDTADKLGVSVGTIRNARNESADLNAVTIARIGVVYGAGYVDPYHALYGATAATVRHHEQDALPRLAKAMSVICDMKGGAKEQLDALPTLRAARDALDSVLFGIEKLRVVS